MAGAAIEFDQKKLNELFEKLDDLAEQDYLKPLKKSAQILRDEIQDNFDKQGALYEGGGFIRTGGAFANKSRATTSRSAWAPLATVTRRQRVILGFSGSRPILERTGKGRKSFRVTRLTREEMAITNPVDYMKYHQSGTENMPRRRVIGFTKKSKGAILRVFGNHIAGIIKGRAIQL